MLERVVRFLRESVVIWSILLTVIGLFLICMGVLWFMFNDVVLDTDMLTFIEDLGGLNAYVLVAGLVLLFIGVYYLYAYRKNRKFVLKEMQTKKRSELMKKRNELHSVVKHLPSKYQRMLREKEEELNIR